MLILGRFHVGGKFQEGTCQVQVLLKTLELTVIIQYGTQYGTNKLMEK